MSARWEMIAAEIARDGTAHLATRVIDWGSNHGYFSVALVFTFSKMQVFSVDGNDVYFGVKSQDIHQKHNAEILQPSQSSRSMLCQGYLTERALETASQTLDYQLALSIFHWLPMQTRDQFLRTLGKFLLKAKTSFLEMPEGGHKGSANYKVYRHWYDASEPMENVIRSALATTDALFTVRLLGNTTIAATARASSTTRQVFRVDVLTPAANRAAGPSVGDFCSHFRNAVNCSNDPCNVQVQSVSSV